LSGSAKAPATQPYQPVDIGKVTSDTTQAALTNMGGIESVIGQSNTFTQNQANAMMESAVPGYAEYAKNLLAAGETALAHPYDLPQDVQTKLEQMAAEKGISVGGGGQFQGFSALSLLGTKMLDYGQQQFQNALSALTTVTGTAPRVNPASPLSMMITPGQALQTATTNAQETQAVGQGAANAAAAASNWNSMAGGSTLMQSLFGTGGTTTGAAGGTSGNNLQKILGLLFQPNSTGSGGRTPTGQLNN
jgi:hypothetical protein